MSNQGGKLYPTAPPSLNDVDDFQRCPPPPTYEESLKMSGPSPAPSFQQTPYYQQPQPPYQFPPHQQHMAYGPAPTYGPTPTSSYGYVNPYPIHMQQQQTYYNASSQVAQSQNVLHFDKRAQIKTTKGGAISVPPPPPGIAPSPAQLAAMSGQQVLIKQKKPTFF